MEESLKCTKWKVDSPETSKLLQAKLFSLGCTWLAGCTVPRFLKCKYIYVDENLLLGWGSSESFFEGYHYTERNASTFCLNLYLIEQWQKL